MKRLLTIQCTVLPVACFPQWRQQKPAPDWFQNASPSTVIALTLAVIVLG